MRLINKPRALVILIVLVLPALSFAPRAARDRCDMSQLRGLLRSRDYQSLLSAVVDCTDPLTSSQEVRYMFAKSACAVGAHNAVLRDAGCRTFRDLRVSSNQISILVDDGRVNLDREACCALPPPVEASEFASSAGRMDGGGNKSWQNALKTARAALAAESASVVPGEFYALVVKHSGKCLDVGGASQDDGADVVQYDCRGVGNQTWSFKDVGGGYFHIVAQHSNKCLDVDGSSRDDGAQVHQWQCHDGDNQKWRLVSKPGGYFHIVAKHSGKCLNVSGGSNDDGGGLIQFTCNEGESEQWRYRKQP